MSFPVMGNGVRRSGADRDSSRHNTQADAIRSGRGTAQREHTELFITVAMVAFAIVTASTTTRSRRGTRGAKSEPSAGHGWGPRPLFVETTRDRGAQRT
jgi:hypothetical protein